MQRSILVASLRSTLPSSDKSFIEEAIIIVIPVVPGGHSEIMHGIESVRTNRRGVGAFGNGADKFGDISRRVRLKAECLSRRGILPTLTNSGAAVREKDIC